MFRYRFECRNPQRALETVNNYMTKDFPVGKDIFGRELYKGGIHFTERDEEIKGFFIDHSENERIGTHGSPIKVRFRGHFTEKDGKVYFDVYIYPRIPEAIFLLFATASLALEGSISGTVIGILVFILFGKGYVDMMIKTYEIIKGIFT